MIHQPLRLMLTSSVLFLLSIQSVSAQLMIEETTEVQRQSIISQSPVVEVTGVRLNQTERGLEVILETPAGQKLQPLIFPQEKTLIIDILDAVLVLPDKKEFRATNPAEGITEVTVAPLDATSIRIRITGEEVVPTTEVVPSSQNLVLSVNPEGTTTQTEADEEIEVIATGEEEESYYVPDASTATRTDTPLRDIPQSIQVLPQQVIQDQGITRISEVTRNVGGVNVRSGFAGVNSNYNIRGFDTFRTLRNGFVFDTVDPNPSNIERIEILKGPASVLYGQFEPGGIINFVTKQPLMESYYAGEFRVGSYEFYQPSIDFSGPLTSDKNFLYRLTAAYETADSFVDFVDSENIQVSPTLTYKIGDSTDLTFSYEYLKTNRTFYDGLPIDPIIFDLPRNRFVGEPSKTYENETQFINLIAEHQFNENWQLRSGFAVQLTDASDDLAFRPDTVEPDGRTLNRFVQIDEVVQTENYVLQTELIGKFNMGPVKHQLLFGFDWQNNNFEYRTLYASTTPLDLFNPVYGAPIPTVFDDPSSGQGSIDSNNIGLYLQDQITLLDNLKLLVGGRYDFSDRTNTFQSIDIDGETLLDDKTEDSYYNEAFSPRVGLVYQPIEPVSLYASYSRSFVPTDDRSSTGEVFEPTRGTHTK